MPPIGLDTKVCTGHAGWPPRANSSASSTVFAGGLGVLRQNDTFPNHCSGPSCHPGVVSGGSSVVFVDGRAAARDGDALNCGSFVANGSAIVIAG